MHTDLIVYNINNNFQMKSKIMLLVVAGTISLSAAQVVTSNYSQGYNQTYEYKDPHFTHQLRDYA